MQGIVITTGNKTEADGAGEEATLQYKKAVEKLKDCRGMIESKKTMIDSVVSGKTEANFESIQRCRETLIAINQLVYTAAPIHDSVHDNPVAVANAFKSEYAELHRLARDARADLETIYKWIPLSYDEWRAEAKQQHKA